VNLRESPYVIEKPEVVYSLPHQRLCKIVDYNKLCIYDRAGTQLFSEDFCVSLVGKKSNKMEPLVRFSQYKDMFLFFVDSNCVCFIDANAEAINPVYLRDEECEIVDGYVDEVESRFLVLNEKCTISYKNYKTNFLSEDNSLRRKGDLAGKALTISSDGFYLAIGYEVNWDEEVENHLSLRIKQDNGYYAPLTTGVVKDENGKKIEIYFF